MTENCYTKCYISWLVNFTAGLVNFTDELVNLTDGLVNFIAELVNLTDGLVNFGICVPTGLVKHFNCHAFDVV